MESFRWHLGTCVPQDILGPKGTIPLRHSSLQSLSLTTSCDCNGSEDSIFPCQQGCEINLDPLRDLRLLCWKAPRREDLDTLTSVICNNRQRLKSLELDFVDWESFDSQYDPTFNWIGSGEMAGGHCMFSNRILRIPPSPGCSFFPDLQTLSLSGVPIGTDLANVVDIANLRSLTLRRCLGWHLFLARIMDRGIEVQLKTLEVQDLPHVASTSSGKRALARFLDAFTGLEKLYVSHVGPSIPEPDLWAHAAGHRATLRRYVQHERTYMGIDGPLWPCELDSPNLGLSEARFLTIQEDVSSNWLSSLNPECMGLACAPEHMKPILLPFTAKSCLKLIHIRQSAQDTRYRPWWAWERISEPTEKHFQGNALDFSANFAQGSHPGESIRDRWRPRSELLGFVAWAFGSHGIGSLQFIVFGDFAHGGREKESHLCFCRSRGGGAFVEMGRNDSRWGQMSQEYCDMLEACPSEPLLHMC
ncbi:hypothetical protein EDB81DRAFT_824392 [Dactylonectria macrodidyma]|uniref:Uncharacterized protein n=1 Tax=Dactylonectria macrodidyma TaxID=307937 RepID=A0A9P9D6Q4_9HYPO|nr:hypothetical protein EDB81DRAFT_824392 [Dactylonectria macrodidyma]